MYLFTNLTISTKSYNEYVCRMVNRLIEIQKTIYFKKCLLQENSLFLKTLNLYITLTITVNRILREMHTVIQTMEREKSAKLQKSKGQDRMTILVVGKIG